MKRYKDADKKKEYDYIDFDKYLEVELDTDMLNNKTKKKPFIKLTEEEA